MSTQSTEGTRGSVPPTSPYWTKEENDAEAAFIYVVSASGEGRERGHVDYCGDVYDEGDQKVGHVTAAAGDVGEVYRGYDNRLGHVTVSPTGDGYIYVDDHHACLLRGVVTAQGEIYSGRYARKVGVVKPPLDAERMGAAVLLLDIL